MLIIIFQMKKLMHRQVQNYQGAELGLELSSLVPEKRLLVTMYKIKSPLNFLKAKLNDSSHLLPLSAVCAQWTTLSFLAFLLPVAFRTPHYHDYISMILFPDIRSWYLCHLTLLFNFKPLRATDQLNLSVELVE